MVLEQSRSRELYQIMSFTENEIEPLEGPFSYHLYIGFSKKDLEDVFRLRAELEKKRVICCLRSFKDEIETSIREGIRTSQRCLLFLSSDYLKDDWYKIEVEAVLEKVAQFGRDFLIVMKESESFDVPDELHDFKHILFRPDKIEDDEVNTKLKDFIMSGQPTMQLTLMPNQNIGFGAALRYFYGYLRLTLPGFKEDLIKETLLDNPNLVAKTVKKMLIILPENCFCSVSITSPGEIEFAEKFFLRVVNRAGNIRRDYKSPLFRIKEEDEDYYFVGVLATPLLEMFDIYESGLCGMTKGQLYDARDAFYLTLKTILRHPHNEDYEKCKDQFRLLWWSDPIAEPDEYGMASDNGNGKNRPSLYQFLLPVVKEELQLERYESEQSENGTTTRVKSRLPSRQLSTFEPVEVSGPNPARIYEEVEQYPMKKRPRGICLIINIINFSESPVYREPRLGSERDTEILKKLFEDLHFKVDVHTDLNAHALECLFLKTHLIDHSDYDAFVCCILSHGKLGVVYTNDGKEVGILSLVEYFSDKQCASLKGKPKLFFIQACQGGDAEPSVETGQTLPRRRTSGSRIESDDAQEGMTELLLHEDASPANSAKEPDDAQKGTTGSQLLEDVSPATIAKESDDAQERMAGFQLYIDALPTTMAKESDDAQEGTTGSQLLEDASPATSAEEPLLVPNSPDFLMSYSTLPGSMSYRHRVVGSFYVQELNEYLRKGMEIDRALKLVSGQVRVRLQEIREVEGINRRFQLPFHLTSGMDRLIFL